MISKEAQVKIASALDVGFISKCAEYGLDWKDPNDNNIIRGLMNKAYEDVQSGEIKLEN